MAEKKIDIEELKKLKDGYEALADIYRYSRAGDYAAIPEEDFPLFRWFGTYRQRPNNGHFMQRIKVPGGQLSPAQLRGIARLTEKHARGFSDITTRQDIQLHWVTVGALEDVFETLKSLGMTTQFACGDTPRNTVSCPLAGVLADEIIDASEHARQISDLYLEGKKQFSNLPRKFKPAIGGCPQYCYQPQINDYGLCGVRRADGQVGYSLMVGGGLRDTPHFAQPLRAFVRPDQVLDVARAVIQLFRDQGYREHRNRSRLKFLVADKGWEWTRNEIEKNLGYPLEHDDTLLHPPAIHSDHMGSGLQKDGRFYVGVPIARGRWTSRNMTDIADLADQFAAGPKRIRLTQKQNAIILDVPRANVDPLKQALDAAGLTVRTHSLRDSLIACTGIEFCNLSMVETKARAARILQYLETHTPLDVPLFISVTGCPNSCAQYQIADIGLTGIQIKDPVKKTADGKPVLVDHFNVLLGGALGADPKFGEVIAKKVPADKVHLALESLVKAYLNDRIDGDESFPHWCGRHEPEYLQKLILDPVSAPDAAPLGA